MYKLSENKTLLTIDTAPVDKSIKTLVPVYGVPFELKSAKLRTQNVVGFVVEAYPVPIKTTGKARLKTLFE
jgi:hypothetical protein